MAKVKAHKWQFRARFRRGSFGWKSRPAIKRIREAVSEIKKVRRRDANLAAEGAVLLLEKLSPALEHVDSSSGAIGTAVNRAIEALVPIIAGAPADDKMRNAWLERLWDAYQEDQMPYIERLGDHWGDLCASNEVASHWADQLIGTCRMAWSPDPHLRAFFCGTTNCLSALLAAERYTEILDLLDMAPIDMWHYRRYGVMALAAMGKKAEAIRYAEQGRGPNDNPVEIARVCEQILVSSGFADEAYRRYGFLANKATTHLAWFRALVGKYPHKEPAEILQDLVRQTPGEEGKWFAAAKDAGLFDEAITLANQSPCSPQTLTRAARDFSEKNPAFAIEAGMTALRWLVEGYGYDITSVDVRDAYSRTLHAATVAGLEEETRRRIRALVASEVFGDRFVTRVLGRRLGLAR